MSTPTDPARPVPRQALQLATLAILMQAESYDWSVHGFGVLRLYVKSIGRIHLWDAALRYPNASMIHNHSWDLASTVVCGELQNTRFEPRRELYAGHRYSGKRLVTGYQTHDVFELPVQSLLPSPVEVYRAGDCYAQLKHEIHRTDAKDGTVSIMRRNEDVEGQADVFWPLGTEWGTAKPRAATRDEIRTAALLSVRQLELELAHAAD